MSKTEAAKRAVDLKLDEALEESFPASDAPAVDREAPGAKAHEYEVRLDLRPAGLSGISEKQIAEHWTLYEGYVKNVNALNEKLAALSGKKDFATEFAELKRRMGFEYDGMILHEHYFGMLRSGQKPLGGDAELTKLMKAAFGGAPEWREEFSAMGKMRGVGWVILYYDPTAGVLSNHWINMHEDGHPAGFVPILVMDVWEHAYFADSGAGGRAGYVEAFLNNVDWPKAEGILGDARGSRKAPEVCESECNA